MTIDKNTHSIRQTIFSLFETNFGKKPEAVRVSANEKCLIIRIEGFLGSIIETMIAEKSHGALNSTRELIVGYMLSQLDDQLSSELDLSVAHFYYDWNDEDLSCIISVILQEDEHYALDDLYPGKEIVHREVSEITKRVEKKPDRIRSFWVGRDFLVVIRSGLLIELENALLEGGHEDALRIAKRKVEKRYFSENAWLSELLGRTPNGVYLDWAFNRDRSMTVYSFDADAEVNR